MSRTRMKSAASCLVTATLLSWFVPGRYAASQNATQQTNMLTAFMSLFGNQPDFMADLNIMVAAEIRMKIARKGGKARREWLNPSKSTLAVKGIYRTIILDLPGSPEISFDPQLKTYTEVPGNEMSPDMMRALVESVTNNPELTCKVEHLGTEMLDGHPVERIRMSGSSQESAGDPVGRLEFYIAKDLKNLILKMETEVLPQTGKKMSYRLSNASLDVPDELFEMPKGYKKVDYKTFKDAWRQNTKR